MGDRGFAVPSGAYAPRIALAAISTGAVIAIVVGAVTLIAGAFYAVVNVQGERIKETREDFTSRVETLDEHIGTRMTEQTARLEQGIDALGDRLEPKIDALSERLDRVEGDLRPAP